MDYFFLPISLFLFTYKQNTLENCDSSISHGSDGSADIRISLLSPWQTLDLPLAILQLNTLGF